MMRLNYDPKNIDCLGARAQGLPSPIACTC
uniref:Transposase n=1 Tax=Meloidogyne hapla TaxID=6305 RepID=A0A1I8BS61_MELHA